MKITIISASTRNNSQSRRVSEYLSERLTELKIKSGILDLSENRLPLYDDTEEGSWKDLWDEMSKVLEKSDGFIFVSPEWDGMFSAGLHNMYHYVDKELADKPILVVGVSSGRGGAYPIQQMRMMGYKKKFVVIPESLFYDHITESLVDGAFMDSRNTVRTNYALRVLVEYTKALASVRKSGVIDNEKFPYGL